MVEANKKRIIEINQLSFIIRHQIVKLKNVDLHSILNRLLISNIKTINQQSFIILIIIRIKIFNLSIRQRQKSYNKHAIL